MTHPLNDYFDSLLGVENWDNRLETAVAPFAEPVMAQDSILPGKRLQLSQAAGQQPLGANFAMALNLLVLLTRLSSSRLRASMLAYCQHHLVAELNGMAVIVGGGRG